MLTFAAVDASKAEGKSVEDHARDAAEFLQEEKMGRR